MSMRSLERTSPLTVGLVAAALAAGVAYFFDPRSGRRRRALVRDKLVHATHAACSFAGKANRDAQHRAQGLVSSTLSHLRPDHGSDAIVVERVRTELGRLSTHPGAIDVTCQDGVVRLRGDVLAEEVDHVVAGVKHVRGVDRVESEMRVHSEPGRIPALQGNRGHRQHRPEFLQSNWSPAPRTLAGLTGAGMLLAGTSRKSPLGAGLAALGGALLTRSIRNAPLRDITRWR
jgi:hypothetical protein